jgi:DNA replication and repair protein RecF
MVLKEILLTNFRNFSTKKIIFNPSVTMIIGENAQGKTNILESVHVVLHGSGFRESKEEELIKWNESHAIIESVWSDDAITTTSSISLQKRGEKVEKQYFINKTKKPQFSYNQYQTGGVLFAPEHIEIINGAPDKRREYFNRVLSKLDPDYKKKLQNYEHALYKRNKVLEHSSDSSVGEELLFWDGYLENQATYLSQKREEYCAFLNQHPKVEDKSFRIDYLKNELTQEKLKAVFEQERRMRRTLIGPQKDDFQLYLHDGTVEENIHHYGSRSEQRLGVFWLKLNEIKQMEIVFKRKPLLLLDDVFSELDTKNKKLVLDVIGEHQTILTTTESELAELSHLKKSVVNI